MRFKSQNYLLLLPRPCAIASLTAFLSFIVTNDFVLACCCVNFFGNIIQSWSLLNCLNGSWLPLMNKTCKQLGLFLVTCFQFLKFHKTFGHSIRWAFLGVWEKISEGLNPDWKVEASRRTCPACSLKNWLVHRREFLLHKNWRANRGVHFKYWMYIYWTSHWSLNSLWLKSEESKSQITQSIVNCLVSIYGCMVFGHECSAVSVQKNLRPRLVDLPAWDLNIQSFCPACNKLTFQTGAQQNFWGV